MPPKKGKAKDGPSKMTDKENLARAEAEILSLQHILEQRTFEAVEARRSERLWREKVDAFTSALGQQRDDTLDITADMMRQYKALQETMNKKVADLEAENRSLKRQLEERDEAIRALQGEQDKIKKECEAEVTEYQHRMEDMQVEFSTLLRETLDKMHDRLARGMS